MSELSDTWQRVNKEKPITVHSPGTLASAGVWLASNSSNIYASEDSDVGSIGVIMMHVSQEGMLTKAGIKVTEIKSAPLKYVGSPAKDLSEAEQAHLQSKIDEHFGLFKKQMYLTRPGIAESAFTGECFLGSQAVQLGIVDGVKTYSSVFEMLSAKADSSTTNSYTEDYGMKRKVTAAMAEAAIQAGADPKSLEVVSDEIYASMNTEGVETLEATTEETEGTDETVAFTTEEFEAFTAQVETLEAELATSMNEVTNLQAEINDLKQQLEMNATDPLRVIAEDRVKVMRTALGMTQVEMSDFSTTSLLAEFKALDKQFKKSYKSGGHVKPTETNEEKKTVANKVTSIETARMRSTGL